MEKLRAIPARTWFASHGEGVFISDPGELWDTYAGVIHHRDQRLLDLLSQPRNHDGHCRGTHCVKKKRDPMEFFDFGERAIMGKHLKRLIKKGEVTFDGATYLRR